MPEKNVATARDALSQYWHNNAAMWLNRQHCGFATDDRYQAFCIATDQIQDTAEAMLVHRRQGFSADPFAGYIELWGILQSVVLQQDAIREMEYAIIGQRPKYPKGDASIALRTLRNILGGHSSWSDKERDGITRRCTIRRQKMSYDHIDYEVYENGAPLHKVIQLGDLLDACDVEAAGILKDLFVGLTRQVSSPVP